jgi:hypothetical protein
MRFGLHRDRADSLPSEVSDALRQAEQDGLALGRVLAGAPEADSRAWLVASVYRFSLVDPARGEQQALVWSRPWHEVDAGTWRQESSQLIVTWVDRSRPGQWRLGNDPRDRVFLQTLRERVQASVVVAEELDLSRRRTGRVVIRQDLATGDLLEQTILGRGVQMDEEVETAVDRTLAYLREQVGLPPEK